MNKKSNSTTISLYPTYILDICLYPYVYIIISTLKPLPRPVQDSLKTGFLREMTEKKKRTEEKTRSVGI